MSVTADLPAPSTAAELAHGVRLAVEYWTVTMDEQDSCGSCDDTLAVVRGAVELIRPLAQRLGITIDLVPRTIATWAEAVNNGIVASPTIRAAGIEMRPDHPDDTETRSWQWRGITTTSVSTEALLDLLVRALNIRTQQVGDFLAGGGPAPYVRQFLHAAPTRVPIAEAPAGASPACGPSSCG